MSPWWLHLIVFIFGYLTCRIFYFFKEVRMGLVLMRVTHALCISCLIKSTENLQKAKKTRILEMRRSGDSERNINAFTINYDEEINMFKENSIRQIISLHPKFYQEIVKFNDWQTAMYYMETEGRTYLNAFANKDIR